MKEHIPSPTAQSAALVRAAHQLLDDPRVFEDPLALAMVDAEAGSMLRSAPERFETVTSRHMRAFVAARSRYAEDELASAIGRGAKQYVILGAGLDTYAYRNPDPASKLLVFEIDHPATQAWKRERLAAAGVPVPRSVVFVPVDLKETTLSAALARVGFERQQITFFSWLGVTPYLSSEVAMTTLAFIASMPSGSGVVFDYAVVPAALDPVEQVAMRVLARRAARGGEPFRSFFEPAELTATLGRVGFRKVEDLGPAELDAHYFSDRTDGLRVSAGLAHLVSARI